MIFDVVTIKPGKLSVSLTKYSGRSRHFTLHRNTSPLFSYFALFADAGEQTGESAELDELFNSAK